MKVKLEKVRLSFPDLWEPKEFKPNDGKPRYSASFLIEPGSANDKAVDAAIAEVLTEKFGAKAAAKRAEFEKKGATAYTDGDGKEYEGYAGMKVLASHRPAKKGPPGIYGDTIDPSTGKVVVLTEKSGKPYAGCYVSATVDIYTFDAFPGIWCTLTAVQFVGDGDAFSGAAPANPDDFAPIEGADADPLA